MLSIVLLSALKLTLSFELGPEYDTNANRAEVVTGAPSASTQPCNVAASPAGTSPCDGGPPTASALLRTTGRATLLVRNGINQLRLSTGLGAKIFFNPDVFDQTVVVVQAAAEDRVRLSRHLELGLQGDYYDAFQPEIPAACSEQNLNCARERDFRNGSLLARAALFADPGDVTVTGGYRGFQYKGDSALDFQAGEVSLLAVARAHVGAVDDPTELTFAAGYHLERRLFAGPVEQLAERSLCAPDPTQPDNPLVACADARADWFHEASFEVTYLKAFLLSAGYALQLNESNSFGQSLLRHIVSLKLAFRLPWQLYVTLKGQVLITKYFDPVLLYSNVASQTFNNIEDENRNAALVDLERPIGHSGVAVNARYSLYTNELGSGTSQFRRQVIFVGLTYRVSPR